MVRRVCTSAGVLGVLVALSLTAASVSRGASQGQVCPPFSQSGLKFQWETVGTVFTCRSAKVWVTKLIQDRVKTSAGNVPLGNGPRGYHCYASLEAKGIASGGLCYKGTLAFPSSGFTWNGS